jgi:hypothetical protein
LPAATAGPDHCEPAVAHFASSDAIAFVFLRVAFTGRCIRARLVRERGVLGRGGVECLDAERSPLIRASKGVHATQSPRQRATDPGFGLVGGVVFACLGCAQERIRKDRHDRQKVQRTADPPAVQV